MCTIHLPYHAAMPLIQVRDVPEATVTALKSRAAERLARRNRRGDAPSAGDISQAESVRVILS